MPAEQIIDHHQHLNYSGRPDDVFLAHQAAMGVTQTIILPAGRPMNSKSTHFGASNGLEKKVTGNAGTYAFCRRFGVHKEYLFGANDVPDAPDAINEIEHYLKLGAVVLGEQKFNVECDSAEMQRMYALAADYNVPVLLHFQYGMYNHGFERLYRMLEQFPRTKFVGHAQTFWAHIDANYVDDAANLYPKGPVTPGGLTDKFLSNYSNLYADLSGLNGYNAFHRDPDHGRAFMENYQDRIIFGTDCEDRSGKVPGCIGAEDILEIRKLAPSKVIERKLLYDNARQLYRL